MEINQQTEVPSQWKKIRIVCFGSFAVAIGINLILLVISFPLGFNEIMMDLSFGNWAITFKLGIATIAFPFLWKYMRA